MVIRRGPTCCGCGVGWGVVPVCSVFTLDTRGRGVTHEEGLPAAGATTAAPPPPTVWVTGLWGSEGGVSSAWRPWESQLGDETCGMKSDNVISFRFTVFTASFEPWSDESLLSCIAESKLTFKSQRSTNTNDGTIDKNVLIRSTKNNIWTPRNSANN